MNDTADHGDQPGTHAIPGPGAPRPPYTPSGFIDASRRFAQAAADGYSPRGASFFFLHAGASVELLLKAALCAASPALLIEGRNVNHDALIRLIGYEPVKRRAMQRRPAVGGSNRQTVRPPHTIGLADAMDRFELLYGPDALGASRDELDLLKAARDLAAHGEDSREVTEDMHRVLVTLATVVEAVLPHVGVSPGDFWGDHVGLIAHAMEKQRDRVVALTRTLISAAKQRFEAQYNGVPRESLETLMMETVWQLNTRPDEWPRGCPACGSQGISRLRPEIRRQASPYRPKRAVAGFKAIDFRCPICNLILESEELVDAVDDFEAWEEAYEDWEVDRWAEEFGTENLTSQDRRELGFEKLRRCATSHRSPRRPQHWPGSKRAGGRNPA